MSHQLTTGTNRQELRDTILRAPISSDAHSAGVGKKRISTEKYKIQIQLSERAKDRLFDLVERTDADSAAQVVREALRVYDVLIDELDEKGSELFLKSGLSGELVRLRLF